MQVDTAIARHMDHRIRLLTIFSGFGEGFGQIEPLLRTAAHGKECFHPLRGRQ